VPAGGPTASGAEPPTEADVLRLMVVDDHDLFRSGLRRLLDGEPGLQVVGEARRGDEAVKRAAELRPDVIVMDVNMPGMSGIEATRTILQSPPAPAVLMLTVSDADNEVLDAVLAGASGYLLKDAKLPDIVSAVRAAAAGQSLIAPSVTGSLLARLRRHGSIEEEPQVDSKLSGRELEVLELLVAGADNVAIGRQLHLSPSTIKHHVSSILDKLGVENRIQAAVLAVRRGLVDEASSSAR
jgi:two-component system, NarL family, nitrate/nitrite response regulator NarL